MTTAEAYLVLRAPHLGRGTGLEPLIVGDEAVGRDVATTVKGWGTLRWERPDGSLYAAMGVRFERSLGAREAFWLKFRWLPTASGPLEAGWSPDAVEYWVRLEPRALTFGRRWWLVCPSCGRRRDALYLPNPRYTAWRCRRCWRLTYHSQRLSPADLLAHREYKLTARLGADWDRLSGWPPKPRGMHWRTYDARLDQLADVVERRNVLSVRAISAILARHPAGGRRRRRGR